MNGSTPLGVRTRVLVLLHGDGLIEAYAAQNVDIRLEQVPYVGTPAGERLADEYLDLSLPRPYRALFYPGHLRAAEQLRRLRPSDIQRREATVGLLRSFDRAAHILNPRQKENEAWTL